MVKKSRRLYLTEDQVNKQIEVFRLLADVIDGNKEFRVEGQKIKMRPSKAIRNMADWYARQLEEQNGGERVIMAWDWPEKR